MMVLLQVDLFMRSGAAGLDVVVILSPVLLLVSSFLIIWNEDKKTKKRK